ncbi:MAG TPA: guanylate kinase [Candidatus Limnocylindrales bacterium]|jgi:guanylate kinase|nr:guanylate kinase [Candidatus Limnocylindrales bacterium]
MLVIISGPSGVGKDTIIRALKRRHPSAERHFVVTYKTRERRPAETDGVDYHFVSEDEFAAMKEQGAFLEATEVHGHWAGTPRDQVGGALEAGRDTVLKIDVRGAETVKEQVPDALRIFVAPPSLEELIGRLRDRGTETPEEQDRRRRDAATELAHQDDYDYVLINETGQAERTADQIDGIITAERARHADRRIAL